MNNKGISLVMAAVLASSGVAAAQEAAGPEEPQVRLSTLLKGWAKESGRRLHVSKTIADLRVAYDGKAHDPAAIRRTCAHAKAVVIETKSSIEAVSIHSVREAFGRYVPTIVLGDAPLPKRNEPVTLVYALQNASSQHHVFSTLRGLASHDPNRICNVTYQAAGGLILVTDLAPRVAYYRALLGQLDQPPAKGATYRMTVYEVPRAAWDKVRGLSPGAAQALLTKAGSTLLGQAVFNDRTGGLELNESSNDQGKSAQTVIRVFKPKNSNKHATAPYLVSVRQEGSQKGTNGSRFVQLPLPQTPSVLGAALGSDPQGPHLVVVLTHE